MPKLTTLSRLELENNLTQLAAHINAATYQFLQGPGNDSSRYS